MIHKAGHIKVSDSHIGADRRCYCGIKGCLESVCSGTALSREASVRYGCSMTNEELFQRAEDEEATAKELIEEYLDALASGLNQYIYLFAPDVIVLGGGVSNALEGYVEGLKERITAAVYSGYEVHIRLSELKENAGILGSAALFR